MNSNSRLEYVVAPTHYNMVANTIMVQPTIKLITTGPTNRGRMFGALPSRYNKA